MVSYWAPVRALSSFACAGFVWHGIQPIFGLNSADLIPFVYLIVSAKRAAATCKPEADFQLDSVEVQLEPAGTSKFSLGGCASLTEFVRGPPGFRPIFHPGNCNEAMKHRIFSFSWVPNFELHGGRSAFRAHKRRPRAATKAWKVLRTQSFLCPTTTPLSSPRRKKALRFLRQLYYSRRRVACWRSRSALERPMRPALRRSSLRIDVAPWDSCAERNSHFLPGEVCPRDFCARRALPGRRLPGLKKYGPYPGVSQGIGRVRFVQFALKM